MYYCQSWEAPGSIVTSLMALNYTCICIDEGPYLYDYRLIDRFSLKLHAVATVTPDRLLYGLRPSKGFQVAFKGRKRWIIEGGVNVYKEKNIYIYIYIYIDAYK